MTDTPITDLDFDSVKTGLKAFLKSQDRFKDYDFEGSNMAVMLDVLAYNAWQQNFFTNMAMTEMFVDSAQLRSSVVSHAKALNYVPRSRVSAMAQINVTLNPAGSPTFVTIPARTPFTASGGGRNFTFYNDRAVTVEALDGVYRAQGVRVYEGRYVTELHSATNRGRYPIASTTVDVSSVRVYVDDVEFKRATTVFGLERESQVFFIQAQNDESYEVVFGDDVFGVEPPIGVEIRVLYRVSAGADANGVANFSAATTVGPYAATVSLQARAAGGAAAESIDSIRYYAPRSVQIQDRAVTESDYEILLKSRFPEVRAVAVYGGEEKNPPRYGRVIVAVDVAGADGVSENNKKKYADFLRERSPLGIEAVIESPQFMFVGVSTTVYLDTSKSEVGAAEVRDLVLDKILSYSNQNLADFRTTLRSSKLSTFIDRAHPAILSNDLDVQLIIPFNPILNTRVTLSSTFGNQLVRDQVLTKSESLRNHKPALKSSVFTLNKQQVFMQDNGKGVIQVIRQQGDSFVVIEPDVGTVNYETGAFTIRNLVVNKYTGSDIRIFGRPRSQTVEPPRSRITSIRANDVTIDVRTA